jgi:hypothetical protein
MKDDDISPEKLVAGDKSGIDLSESRPSLEALLKEHEQHLAALPDTASALDRARVQLDIAETLLALQRKEESWKIAREVFDTCAAAESWQDAIEACDILFQCEQDESLAALGNGVWLSITFPVPAPSRSRHNSLSPCCSTSSTRPRTIPTAPPSPPWPRTISPNCAPRARSRKA